MNIGFRGYYSQPNFTGQLKDKLQKQIDQEKKITDSRKSAEQEALEAKERLYTKLRTEEGLDSRQISKLESIASDYNFYKNHNSRTPKPEELESFTDEEIDILSNSHRKTVRDYYNK